MTTDFMSVAIDFDFIKNRRLDNKFILVATDILTTTKVCFHANIKTVSMTTKF